MAYTQPLSSIINVTFNHGLTASQSPDGVLNPLNDKATPTSIDQSGGTWFFICFFAIIVSVVIYHWYRLLMEAKDEESGNDLAMGSYYNQLAMRTSFAKRRNALTNIDSDNILHM